MNPNHPTANPISVGIHYLLLYTWYPLARCATKFFYLFPVFLEKIILPIWHYRPFAPVQIGSTSLSPLPSLGGAYQISVIVLSSLSLGMRISGWVIGAALPHWTKRTLGVVLGIVIVYAMAVHWNHMKSIHENPNLRYLATQFRHISWLWEESIEVRRREDAQQIYDDLCTIQHFFRHINAASTGRYFLYTSGFLTHSIPLEKRLPNFFYVIPLRNPSR